MFVEVLTPYVEPGWVAEYGNGTDISSHVQVSYTFTNNSVNTVTTRSVTTNVLGSYTIRYDVSYQGKSATPVLRTVVVGDNIPPVITLAGNSSVVHQAAVPWIDPGYSAMDYFDGNITGRVVLGGDTVNTMLPSGTKFVISYNVVDSAGNAAITKYRYVMLLDSTPPVLSMTGSNPWYLEVTSVWTNPGVTAFDTLDLNLTDSIEASYFMQTQKGNVSENGIDSMSPKGTVYFVVYNVHDRAGNRAIPVVRQVIIIDTIPPVIVLNPPLHMEQQRSWPFIDPGWAASDAFDGNITTEVQVAGSVNVSYPVGSLFVLTYNVRDSAGNRAQQQNRTVTIVDRIPPNITLLGDAVVHAQATWPYIDAGAVAYDRFYGNLTNNIIINNPVNTFSPAGTRFNVTYNVRDAAGNWALTRYRTVIIIDTIPPVINLIGSQYITWQGGIPYVDPGANATDILDGVLTSSIVVTFHLNLSSSLQSPSASNLTSPYAPNPLPMQGPINAISMFAPLNSIFTVIYFVRDAAGNYATHARYVTVVDHLPPMIEVVGTPTFIMRIGSQYFDDGVQAIDGYFGNVTNDVTYIVNFIPSFSSSYTKNETVTSLDSLSSIVGSVAGTCTITYVTSDPAGNTAQLLGRIITVLPPSLDANNGVPASVTLHFNIAETTPEVLGSTPIVFFGSYVPGPDANFPGTVKDALRVAHISDQYESCLNGLFTICTFETAFLPYQSLRSLRSNNMLFLSVSEFPLRIASYLGALDTRPRVYSESDVVALLETQGIAVPTNVSCNGLGICTFSMNQRPNHLHTSASITNLVVAPLPTTHFKNQITVKVKEGTTLDQQSLASVLVSLGLQPSSASCVNSTCIFRTYDPVQSSQIDTLFGLTLANDRVVEAVSFMQFNVLQGILEFTSGLADVDAQMCSLYLLSVGIPPSEVTLKNGICTFHTVADVDDAQIAKLLAAPAVMACAVQPVNFSQPSLVPTLQMSGQLSVSLSMDVAAVLQAVGLDPLAPPSCAASSQFDNALDCTYIINGSVFSTELSGHSSTSSNSLSTKMAALRGQQGVLQALMPSEVTFSSLFAQSLANQLGKKKKKKIVNARFKENIC